MFDAEFCPQTALRLKVGTARDSAPDTSTTASLITEDRKTRDHRPL